LIFPESKEYVTFNAQNSILMGRSSVFQTMIKTPMLENASGQVTLEDLSPKSLNVLIKFLYTGEIDKEWAFVPEEIVNAAEKYNLPISKTYCDNNLPSSCLPVNAFNLLLMAKIHGLTNAAKNITEFIKANVEGIMNSLKIHKIFY
jgi:hypothetical protein